MTTHNSASPLVGIVIGDPTGIGPEVAVKACIDPRIGAACHPVLIGSARVLDEAQRLTGLRLPLRVVDTVIASACPSGAIDLIDPVPFPDEELVYGRDLESMGRLTGAWLEHADRLARQGSLAATVMGPISGVAMKMAGTLATIPSYSDEGAYLILRSAPLMIAHLTDHVALRAVSSLVTEDAVCTLVRKLDDALRRWGLPSRRIAVAGLNPHAEGEEEAGHIVPALTLLRSEGIDVTGPVSPDSVSRHCIEGRHDIVVALYHDQGHIAMKTWGFSGNSVVMLGPPYVHTTVAHGVAHDIAGTGTADPEMLINAILNAAYLAAGRGFYV